MYTATAGFAAQSLPPEGEIHGDCKLTSPVSLLLSRGPSAIGTAINRSSELGTCSKRLPRRRRTRRSRLVCLHGGVLSMATAVFARRTA